MIEKIKYKNCKYCLTKENDFEIMDSYKQMWVTCNVCGSTRSFLKKNIFFDREPFISSFNFLNKISKGNLKIFSRDLLSIKKNPNYQKLTYEQYSEFLKNDSKALNLYKEDIPKQIQRIEKSGIDYKNKNILIISGGPGILAKYLSTYSKVKVTEFSTVTVNSMKKYLGLDAYKFDFNNYDLTKIFNEKFDLIIAESVVNFSKDIKGLISSICSLINENGEIIISNDSFSLGYAMSWQFADYIPSDFPNQSLFLSYFLNVANIQIMHKEENKYNALIYRTFHGGWKSMITGMFRLPFWFYYGLLANRPFNSLNNKLWSKNIIYYLKYKSPIN